MTAAVVSTEQRLLTFQVAGSVYALPIASVVEVCEQGRLACVPTLPPDEVGVMNHHGDALPVLGRETLLEVADQELPEPDHVLVVSAGANGTGARIGLPVDRVLGIVQGAGASSRTRELVAERRPIDGRVVFVLDPEQVVARARDVIERSLARTE